MKHFHDSLFYYIPNKRCFKAFSSGSWLRYNYYLNNSIDRLDKRDFMNFCPGGKGGFL